MKPKITLNSDDALKSYLYSIWGGKTFKLENFRLESSVIELAFRRKIYIDTPDTTIIDYDYSGGNDDITFGGCNSFIDFILKYFNVQVLEPLRFNGLSGIESIERMMKIITQNGEVYYSDRQMSIPKGSVIVKAYYVYEFYDDAGLGWWPYSNSFYPQIIENGVILATTRFSTYNDLVLNGVVKLIPKETT